MTSSTSANSSQTPIKFYDKNAEYNFLANTMDGFPIKFNIDGSEFNAQGGSEGVFQASRLYASAKERTPSDKKQAYQETNILCAITGAQQQSYKNTGQRGQDGKPIVKSHFESQAFDADYTGGGEPNTHKDDTQLHLKERIMYEALLMKATQHPAVLKALLATGNAPIVEDTFLAPYNDDYWGNGKSGNGRNALGKLWEMVRNDLAAEKDNGEIKVRTGFSEGLSEALGITSQQFDYSKSVNPRTLEKLPAAKQAVMDYKAGPSNSMTGIDAHFTKNDTAAATAAATAVQTTSAPTQYKPTDQITSDQKKWLQDALSYESGINVSDVMLAGDGKIHVKFNRNQDAAKYSVNHRNADLASEDVVVLTHGKARFVLDKLDPGAYQFLANKTTQTLPPQLSSPTTSTTASHDFGRHALNPYHALGQLHYLLEANGVKADAINSVDTTKTSVNVSFENYSDAKSVATKCGIAISEIDGANFSLNIKKEHITKLVRAATTLTQIEQNTLNRADFIEAISTNLDESSTIPSSCVAPTQSVDALLGVANSQETQVDHMESLKRYFASQSAEGVIGYSIEKAQHNPKEQVVRVVFEDINQAKEYAKCYNYTVKTGKSGRHFIHIGANRLLNEQYVDLSKVTTNIRNFVETSQAVSSSTQAPPPSQFTTTTTTTTTLRGGEAAKNTLRAPGVDELRSSLQVSTAAVRDPVGALVQLLQKQEPKADKQKIEKFAREFTTISNNIPNTLKEQINPTAQSDCMKNLTNSVHSLVQQGPPPFPMENNDKTMSSQQANPKFEFKNGEYHITVPQNFSGNVFVPRLDDHNNAVGHDLLSYKDGKLDAQQCLINPYERKQCKINTKTLDLCRNAQQQQQQKQQKPFSRPGQSR